MQVAVHMPPKTSETPGAWIISGESDVQVVIQNDTVVLGLTKDYNDEVDFTDVAICFSKDNKITLQYDDGNGNPQYRDLNPGYVFEHLKKMLLTVKEGAAV